MTTIKHDEVFTLEGGVVVDSAVRSPHNSRFGERDNYNITVQLPSNEYTSALDSLFQEQGHPVYEHENSWRVDEYTICVESLVAPRGVKEEFTPGDTVHIRCRPFLKVGDNKAQEQLLLVGFVKIEDTGEEDWALKPDEYCW